MGTSKPTKGKQRVSNNAASSETPIKHRKAKSQTGHDDVPGVQKIKAALRQTKRLLQKDKLAADVRVATERRLKALVADLAKAELARVERAMAVRYHKVKFFERQKVLRKINQTKRLLENGIDADGEKLSKKKCKELEKNLFEKRVDLNYVLNYPKTSKYISLFPSKGPEDQDESDEDAPMASPEVEGALETSRRREDLRNTIREAMQAGQMESEPELHLADRVKTPKSTAVLESNASQSASRSKKKVKDAETVERQHRGVGNDAFFEVADE